MAGQLGEYDPDSDFNTNARDHFAMMEHSQPIVNTPKEVAEFLGIPEVMVEKRGMWVFIPQVLAKWRYLCADAMLNARRK